MSTLELPSTTGAEAANGRLFTIADVQKLPTSLPSGDVDYELDNGRLVIVSPPGRKHSKAQNRISAFLSRAEDAGLGEAFTEIGIVLWRDPDRLVGADAAFVARDKCPPRETQEGYLETIPDLVVEIRSKDDTVAELKRKANDYVKAGVTIVWLVDPIASNATVFRAKSEPVVLAHDGVLAEPDILPGFELRLADLFKD
jgi:Uma2 family endonuclease